MPIKHISFSGFFLFFITGFIFKTFASTDVINVNNIQDHINLNPFLEVFHTPNQISVLEVDSLIKAKKLKAGKNTSSPGFSKEFFWLAFTIKNNTEKEVELIIDLDNPHIDDVKLYQRNRTNKFQLIGYGGDRSIFKKRTVLNRRYIFPVKLSPHKEQLYYLLIDKRNAAVSFPLKLWKQKSFVQEEEGQNLLYGIFFGIIMFITLISFFTGIAVKNRLFISYGIYISIMGLYLFTGLGYAFQYIYPASSVLNNYSRVFLIVLLTIVSIDFSIRYLQIKTYSLFIYKTFRVFVLFLGILLFLWIFLTGLFTFYTIILLNIMYVVLFIMFVLITVIFFISYKHQKFNVLSYAFSFGFVILGSLSLILIEYGVLQETSFPIPPVVLGSAFEVTILSASLIYRIKAINDNNKQLKSKIEGQRKELIRAFINGGEKERSFISGELHDNVGSVLAMLKNKVKSKKVDLKEINNDFEKLYQHVRDLSHKLVPQALPVAGFKQTARQLIEDFKKANNIEIKVDYYSFPDLNEEVSLQLYRVLQESLLNIQKHAQADLIEIQFLGYSDNVVLTIDDNGKGFDMTEINKGTSKGLINMQSRIAAINGEIEISSIPGNGTSILINVPL